MINFIYFYLFILFSLFSASISIVTLLFYKSKNQFVGSILKINIAFLVKFLSFTTLFLIFNTPILQNNFIIKLNLILNLISGFLIIYFVTSHINTFFEIKNIFVKKWLFFIIANLFFITGFFSIKVDLLEKKIFFNILYFFQSLLLLIPIFYSIIMSIIKIKLIKDKNVKKITNIINIINILSLPFIIIDSTNGFKKYIKINSNPYGFIFFPIIFCAISFVLTYYVIKYHYSNDERKTDYTEIIENNILNLDITKREKEIIQLLIKGKSNKDISIELDISPNTVRAHLRNIFEKTNISSRYEFINFITTKK